MRIRPLLVFFALAVLGVTSGCHCCCCRGCYAPCCCSPCCGTCCYPPSESPMPPLAAPHAPVVMPH